MVRQFHYITHWGRPEANPEKHTKQALEETKQIRLK